MSIEKTIETIRELGDGDEVGNYEWDRINQQWRLIDILDADGLKALANAYGAKAAECEALQAENEMAWGESRSNLDNGVSLIRQCNAEIERLKAENAELREVLGHYANKDHWEEVDGFPHRFDCTLQGWDIAQAALKKHKALVP